MSESGKAMVIGRNVFVALGILTVVEYVAAIALDSANVLLVILAVAKAWLIVVFFMHIGQLRGEHQ